MWDSLTVAVIFKQRAALAFDTLLARHAAPSLTVPRCTLTGRARAVSVPFRLSRFAFRNVANAGLIDGLTRAS